MKFVYGGSFNPPTLAHLEIMIKIHHSFIDSKIVVVPVGNHYTWKTDLINFNHRFEMLKLLTKDLEYVSISDIENKTEFVGTYNTLKLLKENNEELYFVLGTDHMETMHNWINIDKLIKEFNFLVITRKNYQSDFSFFKSNKVNFKILEFDSNISSTKIRQDINKNKESLSKEVYEYIIHNDLYKGIEE